jgi:endo-1,3(4)-beta-glucanase
LTADQVINASLDAAGNPSQQPFASPSDAVPTTTINAGIPPPGPLPTTALELMDATKANILAAPIATDAPLPQFLTRPDHPVRPANLSARSGPLQTDKFYANFLVGDQREPIWPQPYSLWWAKDGDVQPRMGLNNSWGLAISNIDRDQQIFGDSPQAGDPPKFFITPLYVQEIILSATELGPDTLLTTDSHKQFSVNVNLQPSAALAPIIRFPIVQGMGFVSGMYTGATPLLQSNIFFTDLLENGAVNGGLTHKWLVKLKDGSSWLLYVTPNGATGRPPLFLSDSTSITGPAGFIGLIQVAKNTAEVCGETVHDQAAGAYPISASISASVESSVGTYSFTWARGGSEAQNLLMYALPHHVITMTSETMQHATCAQLWTATKGPARAFTSNVWTLQENNLPVNIDFDPWRPDLGAIGKVADVAVEHITSAASQELSRDITADSNYDSAYFAGKVSKRLFDC